jgi:hypothetical protein
MVTTGLAAEDAARGVVQDVVRRGDGDRALPERPYWCRVGHTYRHKARAPLEDKCNNFCFCKVLLSTIYQGVLALICVLFAPVVCGAADSSLVPSPLGCRLDVSRLDASIPKRVGNGPQEAASTGTWT